MSCQVQKIKVSVFTPTYNRKDTLKRLYESLCQQTVKDFEWIVVDDGSTDGTELLIQDIVQKKNGFDCIYRKQNNSGKHAAINRGVALARGEYFFIVDSDDYVSSNAIERIIDIFKTINMQEFAGICGNICDSYGEIIGTTFDGSANIDCRMSDRDKYNICGDKAEVFYTDILKKFPFPSFKGENFLSEGVVWNRISAAGYLMRFFNEKIYICQYLPHGLSDTLPLIRKQNINGTLLFFRELYMMQSSLWAKCKTGSFYVRYALFNKQNIFDVKNDLQEGWGFIFILYICSYIRIIQGW